MRLWFDLQFVTNDFKILLDFSPIQQLQGGTVREAQLVLVYSRRFVTLIGPNLNKPAKNARYL